MKINASESMQLQFPKELNIPNQLNNIKIEFSLFNATNVQGVFVKKTGRR